MATKLRLTHDSKDLLTKLYDTSCFLSGLGKQFKQRILNSVSVPRDAVIADIGCGTGVFLEIVQKKYSNNHLIGIDPDKQALTIAENRLKRQCLKAELIQAFAESLPLPDNSIDICFSTLALHHMPEETKRKALEEMHRILKPNGKVVIADFGKSDSWLIHKILFFEKVEYIEGDFKGLIFRYLQESGFHNIHIVGRRFPVINIIVAEK